MKYLAKSRNSRAFGLAILLLLVVAWAMPVAGAVKGGVGGKDNAPGQIRKTTTTTVPTLKFTKLSDSNDSAFHFCGILSDTRVACWGNNFYGQTSNPVTGYIDYPISATDLANCDPTVYVCTQTTVTEDSVVPLPYIVPNITGATQVAVSRSATCIIANSNLYCVGQKDISLYSGTGNWSPVVQQIPLTGVTRVTLGAFAACAETTSGNYCWGYYYWNTAAPDQFPVGTYSLPTPTLVSVGIDQIIPPATNVDCSISSGLAYCKGSKDYGQIGDGTITEDYRYDTYDSTPRQVLNVSGVTQIAETPIIRCALQSDGKAYCWGWNFYGTMGNNTAGVFDPGVDENNYYPWYGHTIPWIYSAPTQVIL
jgi:alpha-tubulin suppressor-like RCC1 family protein